ncbi:hypothetical protein [Methylorubrum sp. SB2]|uniref:hypothetical protein n=1 Tax=Methylorubrum subtropicum TaxID=3138812 RepID=UPI00313BCE6B
MSDELEQKLRRSYVDADAFERTKRVELYQAVRAAFQEPDAAVKNLQWAFGKWGYPRSVDMLERQPQRIGTPRGALLSKDGWTLGASERSRQARDLIARLPDMARDLGAAEARVHTAREAYESYCREIGHQPLQPWQTDRRSIGAERVPEHLVPDEREPQLRLDPDAWAAAQTPSDPPDRLASQGTLLDPETWLDEQHHREKYAHVEAARERDTDERSQEHERER